MYVTLQLRFGGGQPPKLDHVSVGLQGLAPPSAEQAGSQALHTALLNILRAATAEQQEALKRAALEHLKEMLP